MTDEVRLAVQRGQMLTGRFDLGRRLIGFSEKNLPLQIAGIDAVIVDEADATAMAAESDAGRGQIE